MKKLLPALALLGLPACFGVTDSSVAVASAGVDTVMNQQLEATLAGTRMAGLDALVYDSRAATATQIHVNDMVANGYTSIIIPGKDSDPDTDGIQDWDMGDTVREDLGLDWDDILQMVGTVDGTYDQMLAEWYANGSTAGSGGQDATAMAGINTVPGFNVFGIAKAGSGADTRWALLVLEVDPSDVP